MQVFIRRALETLRSETLKNRWPVNDDGSIEPERLPMSAVRKLGGIIDYASSDRVEADGTTLFYPVPLHIKKCKWHGPSFYEVAHKIRGVHRLLCRRHRLRRRVNSSAI